MCIRDRLNAVCNLNSPYPPVEPPVAPIILTTSLGCPLPSTFLNVIWPWPVAEAAPDLICKSAESEYIVAPIPDVANLITLSLYNSTFPFKLKYADASLLFVWMYTDCPFIYSGLFWANCIAFVPSLYIAKSQLPAALPNCIFWLSGRNTPALAVTIPIESTFVTSS